MKSSIILTLCQAADVLQISENTLTALALSGQIPYINMPNIQGTKLQLFFNSNDLIIWFNNLTPINTNNEVHVIKLKNIINMNSENLSILKEYDNKYKIIKKAKGFSLQKVPNKKYGFIYYVRFIDKDIITPRRSTHTNIYDIAVDYAGKNRERVLNEYRLNKSSNVTNTKLYSILNNFFKKNSLYLKNDTRSAPLKDKSRRIYHSTIKKHWIPFLKYLKIKELNEINQLIIIKFQDNCSFKGLKPQTVNHYVSCISRIFDYLVIHKVIQINPCKGIIQLHVKDTDVEITGCYNVDEMNGIFINHWDNELFYLLNLVIYSTGMRDCEIENIRIKDIIKLKDCHFIYIPESKTNNGTRIVPLHDYVYVKLIDYINNRNRFNDKNDLLFCNSKGKCISRRWFAKANVMLGSFTRDKDNKLDYITIKNILKNENIRFYSGRHWWKTAMSTNELGEVEECFMGHKVTNDVKKRYNHRDKQGIENLIKKAKEVFKILNKKLFKEKKQPVKKQVNKKHIPNKLLPKTKKIA